MDRIEQKFEDLIQHLKQRKNHLLNQVDIAIDSLTPLQQQAQSFLSQLQSFQQHLRLTLSEVPPTTVINQAQQHREQMAAVEKKRDEVVSSVKSNWKGEVKEDVRVEEMKSKIDSFGSIQQVVSECCLVH